MPPLRLIFFGTAELACASLAALAKEPAFRVLGVVTQPDRPQGRDLRLQPPPVKVLAGRLGLPVWQPERCRQPEFVEHLRSLAPELIVVAAYGQLLPPAILTLPPHGCVNVHTSLLPRHRGAAPIQWALLEGDAETGVTLMQMDAGLDTGDILSRQTTSIAADDTAQTLHDRLAVLGAELLVRTLPDLVAGRISPRPQPAEGVSYARKITKDDGRLDWRLPADVLWRRVRAFTPWPGAFTRLPATPQPVRLKIWRAEPAASAAGHAGEILSAARTGVLVACGSGALRLLELQREGGRRLPAAEFLAGHALPAGTVLA